jgi:tetratricopeptide (TPR) repeat protein
MNLTSQFLLYVTAFRLAIIAAGVVSLILGYRLFIRGVNTAGGAESSIDFKAAGSGFTLKNSAPGTCFGVFGVVLITAMVIQGNPQLTYESAQKAAGAAEAGAPTKLELRGSETAGAFESLSEKGLQYEKAGDRPRAIDAYQQALALMATPMNQLALLYVQQSKAEQALPLARLAAQMNPANADVLETLAEVLDRHGDRAEALNWMEKAASLDSRYRGKLDELKHSSH